MPEWCLGYNNMNGEQEFRKAVAGMMEKTWVKAPVSAENIATQAGCSSILDSLAWCIAEEGQVCIIPGPIYPAFPKKFFTRSRVKLVVSPTLEENNY